MKDDKINKKNRKKMLLISRITLPSYFPILTAQIIKIIKKNNKNQLRKVYLWSKEWGVAYF